MAGPTEFFSIVVAGSMNPPIHHPSWYGAVGILSQDEIKLAVSDKAVPVVCTPPFSQFRFGGVTIRCLQDRWEIQSQDEGLLDRLLGIAGQTFDGKLPETPISAFGLNFHFVRPTGLSDVGMRLAELINSLPLGRTGGDDSAVIAMTKTLPDKVCQETIAGVPEAREYLRVAYGIHHPIMAGAHAHFDLSPRLRAAFQAEYPEYRARVEQIASALRGAKEE
jgi:hypothetical protein